MGTLCIGKAKALTNFGVKIAKTALVFHVQLNLGIQLIAFSNKLALSTKFNRPVLTLPSSGTLNSAPYVKRYGGVYIGLLLCGFGLWSRLNLASLIGSVL